MRIFWIMTLCLFLAGCARPYYVGVPLTASEPETPEQPSIKPGTDIRATLKDGRVVKASFVKFADGSLFFREARLEGTERDNFNEVQQQDTELTDKLYSVPLTEIALLEKNTSGNTNDSTGTAIGVTAIVGMGILLASSGSWMEWD